MNTVVFTVCQRPEYFARVLDSWRQVRGVQDWRLVFMVEPTDRVREQAGLIDAFRHPNKQLVFNTERLGVLVNPYEGLRKAFSTGAAFAALAEEDIVVSQDVLELFEAARRLATRKTVAVCAHSGDPEGADERELVADGRFSPWVWGTDVRVWHEVLEPSWDKDYGSGEGGVEAGWDWNLVKRVIPGMGGHVIRPSASRSQNIGQFGGAHQQPQDFAGSRARTFSQERPAGAYRFAGASVR